MIIAFPCSAIGRITGSITYFKSFVGRDFKAWLQMAMFIVPIFVKEEERKCWLNLSKVTT